MDELRISSKFMKGVISKLIRKALKKKLGYDVSIHLDDLSATVAQDGKARLHINGTAELNKDDFTKVISAIGLE